MKKFLLTIVAALGFPIMSFAQEELVLDFESDIDSLMFLSHNINGFPFPPTASFSDNEEGNMAERMMAAQALEMHLTVTGLIKIDGEVVGIGTEHELVGQPGGARSAWLFILNHPDWQGTFAVEQIEAGTGNSMFRQEVSANPDRDWPDEFQYFVQTTSDARITTASQGLERLKGAKFVEYNGTNPADLKNLGRFRANLRFVITLD